jgi:hypothetical protein
VASVLLGYMLISSFLKHPHATGSGSTGSTHETALLLNSAIDSLDTLHEFESQNVLPQVVNRLNQWLAEQSTNDAWKPDPLLAGLPSQVRSFPGSKTLATLRFPPSDGTYFEESVWLRGISRQAIGKARDPLEQAGLLFDWTVRNIQLVPAESEGAELDRPHRILLRGTGTAEQRAWIFALLARQQHLDVAILALDDPAQPGHLRTWTVAVLSGGRAHLFDPGLGLAVPGPGGEGVATLEQAAGDDALLRRLDLDAEHPYPVRSADLSRVVALVEAAPPALARRMQILQRHLAGDDRLELAVEAAQTAERWRNCPGVAEAQLWTLPFESYRALAGRSGDDAPPRTDPVTLGYASVPNLLLGRRQHFHGNLAGDGQGAEGIGAAVYYTFSRPPEDFRQHIAPGTPAKQVEALNWVRQTSAYWLALITFERGQYDAAIAHFQHRCLESDPDGPWTDGARYNLARCYEAQGNSEKAVALYRQGASPQRHGDLLRARWLEDSASAQQATTSTATP